MDSHASGNPDSHPKNVPERGDQGNAPDSTSENQEVNTSPENIRLAEIHRELGVLLRSSTPVNWQESRRWCSNILAPAIADSENSKRLIALLECKDYIVGGDEHHVVRNDDDPTRVYKFTHGDNFGCRPYFSPFDPDLTGKHFHGTGNADPFFYINRWRFLNILSKYRTRFEGFVPPQRPGWLPRMVISQPKLEGSNPTTDEIRKAMMAFDFVEISQDAYIHSEVPALLTDMAPRNVRIIKGIPVAFDAIAMKAPKRVIDWAHAQGFISYSVAPFSNPKSNPPAKFGTIRDNP